MTTEILIDHTDASQPTVICVHTWSQLSRDHVERICELLYGAEEHPYGGDRDSKAATLASTAESVLHHMMTTDLGDSLWSPEADDPVHVIALLQSVTATIHLSLTEHARSGGLNDMQIAVVPAASRMVQNLVVALKKWELELDRGQNPGPLMSLTGPELMGEAPA